MPPLELPITPQLCRSRAALPDDEGWAYEPKLDGFRAIVVVDGDDVVIWSRSGKPLERYFPEVVLPPGRYVLDGELLVAAADGTPRDFDAVAARVHPAESRIAKLSVGTPATLHAFDLLGRDGEDLHERPLQERRAALEELLGDLLGSVLPPAGEGTDDARAAAVPLRLVPQVRTLAEAEAWLWSHEGVVAKRLEDPYRPGSRDGMVKVRRRRTLDAVVIGWREGKQAGTVGALILGLHEEDGTLRPVGHVSGLTAKQKRELPAELAPYATGERGGHEPNRWSSGKDTSWTALRPELVVEVTYEHAASGRLRHGAKLVRWREDKPPSACGVEQLEE